MARRLSVYQSRQSALHRWRKSGALKYLMQQARSYRELRGQELAVLANEWVGINAAVDGFYERRTLEALTAFLRPLEALFARSRAIDVGANIGNHSVYFAGRFEEVLAFEPNPLAFSLLSINAQQSGRITPYPWALGAARGRGGLVGSEGNMGATRLAGDAADEPAGEPVEIHALDELDLSLERVELIKIDVEGAELDVLTGAAAFLRQQQPLVVFEQLVAAFGAADEETAVIRLLRELEYEICWLGAADETEPALVSLWHRLTGYLSGARRVAVYAGDTVPRRNHSLLVAIPRRHLATLGL